MNANLPTIQITSGEEPKDPIHYSVIVNDHAQHPVNPTDHCQELTVPTTLSTKKQNRVQRLLFLRMVM
ncbi:UNVERIFIED_CONTAM: hypothetical protein PYX00_009775 [Menopon gallinae]|uniref:Uncharacterized protein n=1 Tax=Menopon gallinae TaxID=328185 RepID=A0AAW2HDC0_9NEOP